MTNKLFNIPALEKHCRASIDDFRPLGEVTETPDGITIFKDNGARILAVAHLDTVCAPRHFKYDARKHVVRTPTLDDRLGANIILDVLPRILGASAFDVLLTEGEEIGRSTAAHFQAPRQYDWLFSFDRTGTDAVHYQFTSPAWLDALQTLDMHIESGMFSDIAFMGHLGASAVNVGCAYYQYHSPRAYANLRETEEQIRKFAHFYRTHAGTHFEHSEEHAADDLGAWGAFDDLGYCDECGEFEALCFGLCEPCDRRIYAKFIRDDSAADADALPF